MVRKVGECLGHDIYAVIDGWGLADESTQAYINKQITPTWTSADLGFTGLWTTGDYHRSFWETSVPFATGGNVVKNYDFNHFTTAFGNYMFTLPNTRMLHLQVLLVISESQVLILSLLRKLVPTIAWL